MFQLWVLKTPENSKRAGKAIYAFSSQSVVHHPGGQPFSNSSFPTRIKNEGVAGSVDMDNELSLALFDLL